MTETWPPPDDPVTFESLCLDLWQEIWGDPGADKNGRSGQAQAGVDVFGKYKGQQMGVQCKQKNGLLRTQVTVKELEKEVEQALGFEPPLHSFILATTGPADAKVQKKARQISADHAEKGLFEVGVWSWEKIWKEISGRKALLRRIGATYWPDLFTMTGRRVAPSRLTHTADTLFGRDDELARLDAAWEDPGIRVITLVAWGGVGKTALVAKWAAALAEREYDGASCFDWSFYSQGTQEAGSPSSDAFVAAALEFFGDAEMARSPASAWDKGARLARLVAARRTLLVLDGLEPLQYPPGPLAGELKDPAITALLKGLAGQNPGLCLVTTRERVEDLAAFRDGTAPEWRLERLTASAGARLLESLGVRGPEDELEQLSRDVDGHALTLRLLGQYLSRAHGGDVRRRDRVDLEKADLRTQGGHAFKTMAAYEKWLADGGEDGERQLAVLRLLGLFDRPADAGCLAALRGELVIAGLTEPLVGLDEEDWNFTVEELADCGLVARASTSAERASLDAHPLIREYFGRRLREQAPAAWREAHGRLFDYLREATEHQPDTLEGLQPLYQTVGHGCRAGRQREACYEVYRDRINRGTGPDGFYSTKKLGAFGADLGAVACFFEAPWNRVSPSLSEADQAWLLNQAAFRLRALGRLGEAVEPMRATLRINESKGEWKNAAVVASNLSELELTLGDVECAVRDAEQSVDFADRSGDAFLKMVFRVTLADALHQAGRRDDARERFREAEAMQAENQPEYPLLYSFRGFRYCDLLLADAERAAWRVETAGPPHPNPLPQGERGPEVCGEVEERAVQTLPIAERNNWILDIALDHLTLGRAGLYRAILEGRDVSSDPAGSATRDPTSEIERAVDGLRRSGEVEFVARGLLTRAWLRRHSGDADGARDDLDEAWQIAERGPMRLFQADIQLYRARLFRDRQALAEARRLIEEHGYGRRLEELADAEGAAVSW